MPNPFRLVRNGSLSGVAEYAYGAAVQPDVQLVFAAGGCPLDEAGETVAIGDYAAQAHR